LSPALAAKLLHSHDAPKDMLSRLIDRLLVGSSGHSTASSRQARTTTRPPFRARSPTRCGIHGLCRAAGGHRADVQRGAACFIPTQDKLYLIAGVKLPEGSSLERTDAVLQRMKTSRSARTVSPM